MATAETNGVPRPKTRPEFVAQPAAGLVDSHGISINLPPAAQDGKPYPVRHMSTPAYQSPIRHHRRAPSRSKAVKETLNARSHYGSSDDDGSAVHRINQYVIKQEIGRGSFGAVHLAVDQYGNEYAVKEFSKSRLRKRAQSNLLRQGNQRRRPGHLAAGVGFNSPLHRVSSSDRKEEASNNSLSLIKEEIAIMKKLSHNNLVSLIEVLDDPYEDSLYMVLEMCKKGVVMKVGLEERAEPYPEEACRCWFRDMILGMEYLHAQGVVHRDIKPDNCLITDDDVLKIVDFGVSEMFEKQSDMATTKSAGSPAFMPPELCVAKHGQVSGKAADIWSMGVTLYCLRYGHIPFEKTGILELYESIRSDGLKLEDEQDRTFEDLMRSLLEKDPEKRITMDELRNHSWVTKNGADPLLPAEENCSDLVEPPTEAEMNHAITGNMGNLLVVMRAVKRFKNLLSRRRPRMLQGIFGRDSRLVTPPQALHGSGNASEARSVDAHDRRPFEQALAREGIHRDVPIDDDLRKLPHGMDRLVKMISHEPDSATEEKRPESQPKTTEEPDERERLNSDPEAHRASRTSRGYTFPVDFNAKGHAHDPLEDTLFLGLGASSLDPRATSMSDVEQPIISESPPAVDENIYEQAYRDEMKKVMDRRGKSASMYMNRRVDHREDIREHSNILDRGLGKFKGVHTAEKFSALKDKAKTGGLAGLVKEAREKRQAEKDSGQEDGDATAASEPENQAHLDGLSPSKQEDAPEQSDPARSAQDSTPVPRPRPADKALQAPASDYRQSLAFADTPGTYRENIETPGTETSPKPGNESKLDGSSDTANPPAGPQESVPRPRDSISPPETYDYRQSLAFAEIPGTYLDSNTATPAGQQASGGAQQSSTTAPGASSRDTTQAIPRKQPSQSHLAPSDTYDYRQSLAFDLPGTFPPTPGTEGEKRL